MEPFFSDGQELELKVDQEFYLGHSSASTAFQDSSGLLTGFVNLGVSLTGWWYFKLRGG